MKVDFTFHSFLITCVCPFSRPTRLCAFCNCGEKSLLGQGEMSSYDPTPNFNPFRRQATKTKWEASDTEEKTADESSPKVGVVRTKSRKQSRERSKSPRRTSGL